MLLLSKSFLFFRFLTKKIIKTIIIIINSNPPAPAAIGIIILELDDDELFFCISPLSNKSQKKKNRSGVFRRYHLLWSEVVDDVTGELVVTRPVVILSEVVDDVITGELVVTTPVVVVIVSIVIYLYIFLIYGNVFLWSLPLNSLYLYFHRLQYK